MVFSDKLERGSSDSSKIYYNTAAYWNSQPYLVSLKGYIYIYAAEEKSPALFKIGDGSSYLIDLPFSTPTAQEKDFWNSKVSAMIEGNKLVLLVNS